MTNIALIFAGGVGKRLNNTENATPKQFLEIGNKPIIIHTLELFQNHKDIDKIYIAIHPDFLDYMENIGKKYAITKIAKIVKGGATAQDSIYNALIAARQENDKNTIVLIHDGVRPNITEEVITKNIECAKKNGNAITCTPCYETILISENGINPETIPFRRNTYATQAPQTFHLEEIIEAHEKTREQNPSYTDIIDSCTMFKTLNKQTYMIKGNFGNIKITTIEDLYILEGILKYRNSPPPTDITEAENNSSTTNSRYCVMNNLVRNSVVDNDLLTIWRNSLFNWEILKNKTIFITGTTGLIGSFIIRSLFEANRNLNLNLKVVASARDIKKFKKFFGKEITIEHECLKIHKQDVNEKITYKGEVNFIIHTASATHSKFFVDYPEETYNTIVNGTKNILEFAKEKHVEKIINLSSMEVYGNIKTEELLKEDDIGPIDKDNPRSSYPLAKREAEALCKKYNEDYNIPVVTARCAQIIGSNADYNDFHIYATIARNIVEKKDIVLNTTGEALRSFCYITDAINAIFLLLEKGKNGETYNIANDKEASRIIDTVKKITNKYPDSGYKLDINNTNIYPPTTHWNLDASKLKSLGWSANVSLEAAYSLLISSFYYQITPPHKQYDILNNVFSIRNKDDKKVITVLGINYDMDKYLISKSLCKIYSKRPIKKNKIVFCSLSGKGYNCNPKYITEEIIKRKLDLELVWLFNSENKSDIENAGFPDCVKVVSFKKDGLSELSDAKIWIDNARKLEHVKSGLIKRKEQVYINTFHGSFGIKKLGKVSNEIKGIQDSDKISALIEKDGSMVDYFISNCEWEEGLLKDGFTFKNCVAKRFGHPRNDIFFKSEEEKQKIRAKVFSKLGITSGCKFILYAPTYRSERILDCYAIDTNKLINLYGDNTVIAVRMHPSQQKDASKIFKFNDKIINASFYPDIQELMLITDIMITDYSSCIFDFLLTGKPGFIFATDLEKYNNKRGFYYPIETTPFPIATSNDELIENIRNFNIEEYKTKSELFLKEKGSVEDGKASERTVDLIEKILKGEQ